MKKIKESPRIKYIENKWRRPIEKLLQQWHWQDNLKHKEIGKKLNIPRPTITRWFHQLKVPTQRCTRFTNNNLLYLGPNRLPKKPKPPKKPKERVPVNEDFFKKWSPEMAYILGFFIADGCLFINPRGSRYLDFQITDRELLYQIRDCLDSKHKIKRKILNKRWKPIFRMQIGSKKMFISLNRLGVKTRKTGREKMPILPKKYFTDFLRGYFDGDGNIWMGHINKKRQNPTLVLVLAFTCKSKKFLSDLRKILIKYSNCNKGSLYYGSKAYRLAFSTNSSLTICRYMYKNIPSNLFLPRKKVVFEKFLKSRGGVA